MNAFVILTLVLHVVSSLGLIGFVLLHSGKGTGVSSMFGAVSSAVSGTGVIERNLDRITIAFAIVFFVSAAILMMTYSLTG